MLIPGISLLPVILSSQYLQGLLLPIVLVFMVLLVNDKTLMGKHANGRIANLLAWISVGLVILLDLVLLAVAVLGDLRGPSDWLRSSGWRRAPVKAMALSIEPAVQVGPTGILGDRRYAVIDPNNRLVSGKRIGPLATIVPGVRQEPGSGPRRSPALSRWLCLAVAVELGRAVKAIFHGTERPVHEVVGPFSERTQRLGRASAPARPAR